jgi:hypothetical protein
MKNVILSLFLLTPFCTNAQELITTTGGAGSGVLWTIGDVVTATITDSGKTGFLTQGFLQPEHLSPTAIEYPRKDDSPLSAYPNPVTDQLYIRPVSASGCSWKIYDSTGRILDSGQFSGQESAIDFGNYAAGYYILVAVSEERTQTIKIIK